MAKKKHKNEQGEAYAIPIEWHVAEDIVSRYATNMTVQYTGHEFIISFFEAHPPLLIAPPEVVKEQLKHMPVVRAECVARIIVAKGRMPEFIDVLRGQLDRYRESFEDSE